MAKYKLIWTAVVIGLLTLLVPALVCARSISLKDSTALLPVFAIIGGALVFLQLIPALILVFGAIAMALRLVAERKRAKAQLLG